MNNVVDLKKYRDQKIKEDIESYVYTMEIDGELYEVELQLEPHVFDDEDEEE